MGATELAQRFHPPRRFEAVRFSTYEPNPAHPSQAAAREALLAFVPSEDRKRRRSSSSGRPGLYLDGGFGVGKTHLLASAWHESPGPKSYVTFEELTALIGFEGMKAAVEGFRGHRLLCIDEFELDDVANTRMAVTFLRSVIGAGTKVIATSNAVPEKLGEGRFNAEEFVREISAIASHFDVLTIDGPDYRATSRPSRVEALDEGELPTGGTVDEFDALLAHLRRVHPIQYGPLIDGLPSVAVRGVSPIADQGLALLFVQLIDEIYDSAIEFAYSGCRVVEVFPESYRHGGYRKKYGRCESRLAALLGENDRAVT